MCQRRQNSRDRLARRRASRSSRGTRSRTCGRGRSPCPSSRRSRSRSAACRPDDAEPGDARRSSCAVGSVEDRVGRAAPARSRCSIFLARPTQKRRTPYGELVERVTARRRRSARRCRGSGRSGPAMSCGKKRTYRRRSRPDPSPAPRAPVDVHDVADRLWKVKNEMPMAAGRCSRHAQGRQPEARQRAHPEAGVLEHRQEQEVHRQPEDQQLPGRGPPAAGVDAPGHGIGDPPPSSPSSQPTKPHSPTA